VALSQPQPELEPTGRPIILLLLRLADDDERAFPFDLYVATELSAHLAQRVQEAEAAEN
jgi:hypothetical protein